MALNSPADLKLGTLGHIADGKSDTTSQTSLNDCGRDSGTGETAMWGSFQCGSLSCLLASGPVSAGSGRGEFKIGLKNDVGVYMGGGASITYISSGSVSSLGDDFSDSYYYYLSETSDGSLYESRIAQNSDNAGDYGAIFTDTTPSGSTNFTYNQDGTDKDKFEFQGGGF